MHYDTIRYEIADDVALITLARPEVMNALSAPMRAELTHAIQAGGKDARVVVLTGDGRSFCSGQDLGDRESAANIDLERVLRDEYMPMLSALVDCPRPTIAAVNGAAAGAGANLALAADVVIAAESAFFMQAFTRIGLMPDAGGTWMLPRQMGIAKAMGAALFADRISAAQAERWGMIWEAVPDAEFEAIWKARAAHLAQGPSEAYARIKRAIRGTFEKDFDGQLLLEAQLQGECGMTRDFKEGVVAFHEKRPAKFEGR
ncbi:2-(1,2-epoxy-1,2-dihydrophenyl)acetyl-CoA isomerase [Alloyangia pacifica]|uniref:2-(1,2-epoxy-1,2-dihydrophenyl)acetyl-CoA isomerase n=1 Tax=Alloyangia pacifica TaxID=311180 RepID=A0A2U8HFT6_9RHOB|nr:enoyl-CoA hydratase-related protein [Alloyangia pacifica]AWI83575.1 2-(1,2-epoxy-1,2-dihydrophenyl)acetyl-CoA isomerase [Alloyangia pacifica]